MITMRRVRLGSCLLGGGVFLLCILFLPVPAPGNGGYKSLYGYPAAPAIPVQRAMIVHRDGMQTLIVESAFDSPSPEVGWILPLPAEPVDMDVGDGGMLLSLSMAVQPRVRLDAGPTLPAVRALFFLTLFIAVLAMAFHRPLRHVELAVIIVLIAIVATAVLLPSLSRDLGSAGTGLSGVTVSSARQIGDYQAAVLRADDAAAFSRWLQAHELAPLDPAERAIVDDYIARGWCFIVAHLRRDGGGQAVPHPLVATFPAERPVFPMKLTAIGRSKTLVELFVVADQQAGAAGFRTVAADAFAHRPMTDQGGTIYAAYYESYRTGLTIGNPDAANWMWDGCVITKLSAELTPQQMDRDVELTLHPLSPQRELRYGPQARRGMALMAILIGGTVSFAAVGVIMNGGRRPSRRELLAVLVLLGLTFSAAAVVYAAVSVTPVRAVSRAQLVHNRVLVRQQANLVQELIADGTLHQDSAQAELAAFAERLPGLVSHHGVNPFTDAPFAVQRTAGNFALREIDGLAHFCLYDEKGREVRLPLPPGP